MRTTVAIAAVGWLAALPLPAAEPVPVMGVRVGGFWGEPVRRITAQWLPHCVRELEPGGQGEDLSNLLAAGQVLRGEPVTARHNGSRWGDAYIYNTIESICLALEIDPAGDAALAEAQARLRRTLDAWIPVVLAAQTRDGYTHSFSIVRSRPPFSAIHDHEFYVMGYLIEAGVAHHRLTGGTDRRLYDAALRCADHLDSVFGPPPKRVWKNGHTGLEMALTRLGRSIDPRDGAGKGDRHLHLAKHFMDHHHELDPSPYTQSDRPVVDLPAALGHAVRATYLYAAMADVAEGLRDDAYGRASDRLWANVVDTKLYVNGGAGALIRHEAFGEDYFLPNHNGYSESCAACGMVFWATQMYRLRGSARFMDTQERVLFNHLLGSLGMDGVTFHYPAAMASQQERYGWHVCPCCVGNIPRVLLAVKDLVYALDAAGETLFVNQFVDLEGDVAGVGRLRIETRYPWDGRIALRFLTAPACVRTVALRIPGHADSRLYTADPPPGSFKVELNGRAVEVAAPEGYARITHPWRAGDEVVLTLDMGVRRVRCDDRVEANRGRVAVQRGPLLYNFESVDHGGRCTYDLRLPTDAALVAGWRDDLVGGVMAVTGGGLTGIPNYARLNRGGFSTPWLIEDPGRARSFPLHAGAAVTVSTFTSEKKKPQRAWINDQTLSDPEWRAPQFDFHPNKGTAEWIQYTFDRPATVRCARVWWFDEGGKGGCAFPASWRITVQDADGAWKPVEGVQEYPAVTEKARPSEVSFPPVTARAFRLELQLQPKVSTGVQEWIVE